MDLSEKKTLSICEHIDRSLDEGASPFAAFDCDGTLWDKDVGRIFFQYQIDNKLIPLPKDPWNHFETQFQNDKAKAFLWLAQINNGVPVEEVREWAQRSLKNIQQLHVFKSQQKIMGHLLSKGVKVFLVTASVRWAIEPGAQLYGLDKESVIGVTTKLEDNIVTSTQDGPVTHGPGKLTALMQKIDNSPFFFASGNTKSDLHLLEFATNIRLAMASAHPERKHMFKKEQALLKIAKEKNWYFHEFYKDCPSA